MGWGGPQDLGQRHAGLRLPLPWRRRHSHAARTVASWQTLSLRACPALPAGGINDQQYVKLRSEAKAPFRLTRIIFLGGLAAGAALGLFIITGRLLAALQGERALLGCPTGCVLGFQAVLARTWALLCWCAVCGIRLSSPVCKVAPGKAAKSGIALHGVLEERAYPGLYRLIQAGRAVYPPAGGEGAPDLQETVQNFGINSAALAVLGFFVYRDVAAARRDQAVVEREEALARLQVPTLLQLACRVSCGSCTIPSHGCLASWLGWRMAMFCARLARHLARVPFAARVRARETLRLLSALPRRPRPA